MNPTYQLYYFDKYNNDRIFLVETDNEWIIDTLCEKLDETETKYEVVYL